MHDVITMSLTHKNARALFSVPKQLIRASEREYVDWIVKFFTDYSGELPTLERFQIQFPNFTPIVDPSPLDDIVQRFVQDRRANYADFTANNVLAEDNKEAKVRLLQKGAVVVSTPVGGYSTFKQNRTQDYSALPPEWDFPMPGAQSVTGGMSRGDVAFIHGFKGTRKTTVLLWLALHFMKQSAKILFVSTEMKREDIFLRLDAMLVGFNPLIARNSDNAIEALEPYREAIDEAHKLLTGDIIIYDELLVTPSMITAQALEHGCDMIMVDGVYKLLPDGKVNGGDWNVMVSIVNALNRAALTKGHKMAVFGTTQSNNEGNVGRSMAFEQDAAILWKTEVLADDRIKLRMEKNRHYRTADDLIIFDDDFQISAA